MALTEVDAARLNDNVFNTVGPFTNRIINGDMRIDQRNAGASVTPTTDNTYTLDRWTARNFGGSGRFSIQNTTASVPTGFSHSAVLTVTTADATNASTYSLCQRIEGFNTSDLGLGSTTANNISISFWVRSSLTGTYCVSVRNNNADRSYVSEYTISAANTWEYKTVTLPTVASGTWEVTNSAGILLDFIFGSNSGRETTAGAWQSGNFVSTSNQTEWIATNGATFYITGVQLEAGSVATPFERRSYGQELSLCQRYYTVFGGQTAANLLFQGYANSTSYPLSSQLVFPDRMRTAPTVTREGTWSSTNVSSVDFSYVNPMNVTVTPNPTSAGNFYIYADSSDDKIIASAEL